jgi:hypothetical protein
MPFADELYTGEGPRTVWPAHAISCAYARFQVALPPASPFRAPRHIAMAFSALLPLNRRTDIDALYAKGKGASQ